MCVAIPVKIVEIKGSRGLIEFGGLNKEIELYLTPHVSVGDYVLLHAGFAIKRIDEDEAKETLRLLEEISEISG
ncbi:MAG TPA: HypC/HybG/HupF family hydrogenase formation chaperone [Desulfobacteraceae bacterium]|nr:HypC/HybG/HupF family hydrogenase formation chaperone [Desulfobacteraceae bacterium]